MRRRCRCEPRLRQHQQHLHRRLHHHRHLLHTTCTITTSSPVSTTSTGTTTLTGTPPPRHLHRHLALRQAAKQAGLSGFALPAGPSQGASDAAFKYAAAAAVLRTGCSVLLAEASVKLRDTPFPYLHRQTDVEGVSTGGGRLTFGGVVSVDDRQMGWSRYAQSLAIAAMTPHLVYLAATPEAVALVEVMRHRMAGPWSTPASEHAAERYALTEEVFAPAHDGVCAPARSSIPGTGRLAPRSHPAGRGLTPGPGPPSATHDRAPPHRVPAQTARE